MGTLTIVYFLLFLQFVELLKDHLNKLGQSLLSQQATRRQQRRDDNRANQITIKKNDLKYKIRKQAAESEYHIRSEMGRGIYE